jgi:hypothetical protein
MTVVLGHNTGISLRFSHSPWAKVSEIWLNKFNLGHDVAKMAKRNLDLALYTTLYFDFSS